MKAPISWLKDYVDLDMEPQILCDAITMSGSKVEELIIEGQNVKKVVVCKVVDIQKHPDADKLVVCKADVGNNEIIQIVTGAPNVSINAFVPCCLDGAELPDGTKIKKGKLRGVESCGMFCSASELGKSYEDFPGSIENGLLILNDIGYKEEELEAAKGMNIMEFLGLDEKIIDFEITSNRPDCFSIIGLAREAAATFNKEFKYVPPVVEGVDEPLSDYIDVKVEDSVLCPRYVARAVKDVKIGPSPKWMRDKLHAAGIRSINNIVDITNYVMLEYGQPMHSFDLNNIKDKTIIVRRAKDKEKILTLDGEERELDSSKLVIADTEKPIAVAGVMGGEFSGINEDTHTVIFESAVFEPAMVRLGAKSLGMRTEASSRFEKGLDTNNTIPAIDRACELVQILNCGTVINGRVDIGLKDKAPAKIKFRPDRINAFLGTSISSERMLEILNMLEIKEENGYLAIPTFRPDLVLEADIAEEIARFYGYDKIESSLLEGKATTQGRKTENQTLKDEIRKVMYSCGLYEALTYSFTSPKVYDMLTLPQDDCLRNAVVISNPLGEDFSVMRTTMIPDFLKILSTNYNRRTDSAKLYEIAYVYKSDEKPLVNLPDHVETLAIGMYGPNEDFYKLKGIIENLVDSLGIKKVDYVPCEDNVIFHPGRCAKLLINGVEAGVFGEIHPTVAENFECPGRTYVAEIKVLSLIENAMQIPSFKELPKYPAVTRDLAMVVKDDVLVGAIDKIIKQRGGALLENVKLFDVYKGEQVAKGMKSIAYSLVFRAEDRTLTDDEIQKVMNKILNGLETGVGAQLR